MRWLPETTIPLLASFVLLKLPPMVSCSFRRKWIGANGGHDGVQIAHGDFRQRKRGRDVTTISDNLILAPQGLEESRRNDGGFEPYADNGGTIVAVAGQDYCIIAADSRLSNKYTILSRNVTRIHQLSDNTHLATAGCWADTQGLLRLLRYLINNYELQQRRPIGTEALSRMLSTHLYYRRSFPFYTFNIVAGLDTQGVGAVYGYDAVGSFERVRVACAGGGLGLMQPVLDRLDAAAETRGGSANQRPVVAMGLEEALSLVKRAFKAGAERDISLGDEVDIMIVTRADRRQERMQLKSH